MNTKTKNDLPKVIWGKFDTDEGWVKWSPLLFKAFRSMGSSQLTMEICQVVFSKSHTKRPDGLIKVSKKTLMKTLGATDGQLRKEFVVLNKLFENFRIVTSDKGDVYDPSVVVKALNEYVRNNKLQKRNSSNSVWGDIGQCSGYVRKYPEINRLYRQKKLSINQIGVFECIQYQRRDDAPASLVRMPMGTIGTMIGVDESDVGKAVKALKGKTGALKMEVKSGEKRTKGKAALCNEYDLRPCIKVLEALEPELKTVTKELPKAKVIELVPVVSTVEAFEKTEVVENKEYFIGRFVEANRRGWASQMTDSYRKALELGATEEDIQEGLVNRKAA